MNVLTLGERIKKVRKELDLTQQRFADRLGVRQNTIALIESGKRNTSDQLLFSICREFNVNETWLRTGEGEMFLAKPTSALDALAVECSLSSVDYILVEKFLALKPETRKAMADYMREVIASISSMEADAPAHLPTAEERARARMKELYPQILLEEEQADESSASQDDTGSDTGKMA